MMREAPSFAPGHPQQVFFFFFFFFFAVGRAQHAPAASIPACLSADSGIMRRLIRMPREECGRLPAAGEEAKMGLQISARKSGAVTILDLQGRITIGASNDALNVELRKLADAGPSDVIVNLTGVTQMDSSGISTLVRAFVTLERQGGGLEILNPVGHVREVLELTRLINSIPTFTDEKKAIATFRGGVRHA
jgi:anti-sigma B factor antagonist